MSKTSKELRDELQQLRQDVRAKTEELRDAIMSERGASIGCTVKTCKGELFVVKNATMTYSGVELQCVPIRKDGTVGTAHRVVSEYDGWMVVQ